MEIGNMAYTLRESNKIIVVTPDNTDTRNFVEWWCDNNPGFPAADLWPEKMPELSFMNVPNLCQYVRFMKDDEEVEEYLSTSDIGYNPSIPDIYVAINFDSYPNHCILNFLHSNDLGRSKELDLYNSSKPGWCSHHVFWGIVQMKLTLNSSLMNDYQKRMSSSGLTSYIRSSILTYDSLGW